MAKQKQDLSKLGRKSVHKRTNQGGHTKTSSMNKSDRRSFKKYRGQG
jgi:hypothetical protein